MHSVQLITYPDSIGGSLKTLSKFLVDTQIISCFPSGLHILPPYPSSGDRGFAPITYEEIDPVFGNWADIEHITKLCPITLDVMVNHLSRKSKQFEDVLTHGTKSMYLQMFLSPSSVWENEQNMQDDLKRIFLRRQKPYSTYRCLDGTQQLTFWTTFGSDEPSEQIDLDVHVEVTQAFYRHLIETMGMHGISCIRLDAVGYAIKKPKTSCFFVEPEIMEFITWLKDTAEKKNIEILAEVHAPLPIQHTLARAGIPNYDFASPLLILDALIHHEGSLLCSYLQKRPPHMITMLDCHDGIPVFPDVQGLLTEDRVERIVKQALENGANLSTLYSPPESNHPVAKVHQINCTYLSALAGNHEAMICARAIQMFMPGRPQVYYVGLFGGLNDEKSQKEQKDRRAVNRRNYSMQELIGICEQPLVSKQLDLIRLRNTHPAFQGTVQYETSGTQLCITWKTPETRLTLSMDLLTFQWKIS